MWTLYKKIIMDWKQSLDRYLTTPPSNDDFYEEVLENLSPEFWDINEDRILYGFEPFETAFYKLSFSGKKPKEVATIIERLFKLYKL